jgi:ABC-type multidrug transport system ATPase subunit
MEETEECDRVIVMSQGRQLVAGSVADIVGSRKSVAVNGAEARTIDQLRAAGMTVLADPGRLAGGQRRPRSREDHRW